MKALIVDDEALVRSELVYGLARVAPECEVVQCDSAVDAIGLLAASRFDVVFLDIALPGLSGIEAGKVIGKLPDPPDVVFVTAFEHHAVDAFALAATDYLVKPVSETRLAQAVDRVRLRRKPMGAAVPAAAKSAKIALEGHNRTHLVRVGDIRVLEANGHVVSARLFDGTLRFRGSLGDAAARLEPAGFLRVHRSYLVNPDHVIEAEPFFGGTYILRIDDKARSEVPVSRGFMPAVRKAFGL